MLDIINNLKPFFDDCYAEVSVRQYSRMIKISPPTASKILKDYAKEGLLKMREDKGYILFRANRDSDTLKALSRIYWAGKFSELLEYLDSAFHSPTIILFGSLSKLEVKEDSDIDLAIFSNIKKKLILEKFEKQFKRKIQVFYFNNLEKISKNLKFNVINGYILKGEFK